MTSFELRAWIVLHVAKWLKLRWRDLHDSYPYNPYCKADIDEITVRAVRKFSDLIRNVPDLRPPFGDDQRGQTPLGAEDSRREGEAPGAQDLSPKDPRDLY